MSTSADPVPLWVDTDGGVDDALALLYLVAAGRLPIGISSVDGVVAPGQAAANAAGVLAAAGVEVPVHAGRAPERRRRLDAARHGPDGIGGTGLGRPDLVASDDGVGALLSASERHPGLVVLATGPATNLAAALREDPGLAGRLGGLFLVAGATPPVRDTNTWLDPGSMARVVHRFAWRGTLQVVTLDATADDPITGDALERFAATSRFEGLPWALGMSYHDAQSAHQPHPVLAPHDALAAVVLCHPAVVLQERRRSVVVVGDRLRAAGPGEAVWIERLAGAADHLVATLADPAY